MHPKITRSACRVIFIPDRGGGLFPQPVSGGGHARMVLEVFPEKRLVGEIQVVGDLLDAHRGVFSAGFGFVAPHMSSIHCTAVRRCLADDRREVFGRQVQLAGIRNRTERCCM